MELRGIEPLSTNTNCYHYLRRFLLVLIYSKSTTLFHLDSVYRELYIMQVSEPQQLHASISLCFGSRTTLPLLILYLRLYLNLMIKSSLWRNNSFHTHVETFTTPQWNLWDSNPGQTGYEPGALTN